MTLTLTLALILALTLPLPLPLTLSLTLTRYTAQLARWAAVTAFGKFGHAAWQRERPALETLSAPRVEEWSPFVAVAVGQLVQALGSARPVSEP